MYTLLGQVGSLDWQSLLANLKTVVEIAAILIAGIWAYVKVFRGRLFKAKIQIDVDAKAVYIKKQPHILVTVNVKNLGFCRFRFDSDLCAMRVFMIQPGLMFESTHDQEWIRIATFPILRELEWLDPTQSVEDDTLISLHNVCSKAVRVTPIVVCGQTYCTASTIVPIINRQDT
jgi:hypothetical protein